MIGGNRFSQVITVKMLWGGIENIGIEEPGRKMRRGSGAAPWDSRRVPRKARPNDHCRGEANRLLWRLWGVLPNSPALVAFFALAEGGGKKSNQRAPKIKKLIFVGYTAFGSIFYLFGIFIQQASGYF